MIDRRELQTLEEETKSWWKTSLALLAVVRYPRLASELLNGAGGRALPAPPAEEGHAASVLIVGDDPAATGLGTALNQQGVEAALVGSLEEAMALTESNGVRTIVVDEALIDSLSSAWQLRQHKPIPVVLLGSSPDREGWERAFDLEADAYLSKATGIAEQAARVKAILRRY